MPLELLDSPCAVPPFVGCFIKGSLCGLILYCSAQNLLQPTLRNSGPCHYYYYSHCGRALSIYLRPCQIYYTSAARKKSSAARIPSLSSARSCFDCAQCNKVFCCWCAFSWPQPLHQQLLCLFYGLQFYVSRRQKCIFTVSLIKTIICVLKLDYCILLNEMKAFVCLFNLEPLCLKILSDLVQFKKYRVLFWVKGLLEIKQNEKV